MEWDYPHWLMNRIVCAKIYYVCVLIIVTPLLNAVILSEASVIAGSAAYAAEHIASAMS